MTDQPRDLAAEVQRILENDRDPTYYNCPAVGILLLHIAALSRELDQVRDALVEQGKESWKLVERLQGELTALRRPSHLDLPAEVDAIRQLAQDTDRATGFDRFDVAILFEQIDTTARQLRERVEMLSVVQDALSERNRECVELRESRGRLEQHLRWIDDLVTRDADGPVAPKKAAYSWETVAMMACDYAHAALTASQQHTAGGTEPAVLRLSGHQVNILREFTDGDESFPVLIQRLPERTACNGDRMQEGLYVWSEDYPDEGVLLLPEDPGQQHTAGSGDGVAGD